MVSAQRVCGLGVAGRAFRWDDEKMRDLARHRAARNLAGMLRTLVSSAMVVRQSEDSLWTKKERYLEIDEDLVASIESASDVEIWFDVDGEGPFREAERTYACACMSAAKAGITIDAAQAKSHAFARQYPVDEVPRWLSDPEKQNRALRCAVGYHPRMFHAEEMLGPLTDSVREQLLGRTETWILSELDDREICRGYTEQVCRARIDSVMQAATEGVSRGVALTGVWLDRLGIGPNRKKMSAYGWGCVFDAAVLKAARQRLEELNQPRLPQVRRVEPSPLGRSFGG